jgi:histidinol phosphatase-like enzyme (inositol monophosphatase family)
VTNLHRHDVPELLACAHALADASAAAILPYFRQQIAVENKAGGGGYDPVTAADQAAERAIAAHLRANQPTHGIVGEEFGSHLSEAQYKWVIDPIDGTRSFIMGAPVWGTLIGLLDGANPIMGVMNQPFTGERFWSDGAASFAASPHTQKPTRLKTRPCSSIADAVLASTHPDMFPVAADLSAFHRVKAKARMTRYGLDCYAYCMLAAGFADVIIECSLQPYDIVALIPIIEHAGGRVSTWDGGSAAGGGRILACGDPKLHDDVLAILNAA